MNHSGSDPRTPGIRVLLVEPDRLKAAAIRNALDSSNIRCDITVRLDAASALAEAPVGGVLYEVAVSSNSLPDASGLEFYNKLRGENETLPVLLLFDSGEEHIASTALLAGVDAVLVRDDVEGYLLLLPGLVAKLSQGTRVSPGGSPERLAVIVQSDPESTEYQTAARSLRASEQFWKAVVENPFEYVLLVDRNATIQYLNRTAPGVAFDDVIGKMTLYDFVKPDMQELIRGRLDTVFRDGVSVHWESFLPDLERWFTNTSGPLYKDGEIIGASIFARDITERKQVENQLRESEQRFRQVAESIGDAFYILDAKEMRALYVSPAYEGIYGRSVESVYEDAMSWMAVVHPDDRERVKESLSYLGGTETDSYHGPEYRIVRADGSIRWLKHRAFFIDKKGSEPVRIVGIVTDVTTAKEAEEKLRESERKYRTLVDQASDAIFVTDGDGRHVEVNAAACQLLGYTREDLLELGFFDVAVEDDLADDPPRFDLAASGDLVVKERRLRRKDGSVITIEGTFKRLPNGLIQAIVRDVTERKRAEKELRVAHAELEQRVEERTRTLRETLEAFEQTQRLAAIGTLAAGIAHEINNPIGSILMAADTALYALDEPDKKGEVIEALASIKADAKRTGQIVKTVLQLSRQEVSQKWPHDLGEMAHKARDLTRRAADTNEVEVQVEIAPALPMAIVNPTEIEQVFVNVITNAIEASNAGQTVLVRLTGDDEFVHVEIVDQGEGMTPEDAGHVFDPFYTTRQSSGGTGLGMSLSYSIVKQHHGTIDIDSKLGEGTRISVSLPVEKPSSEDGGTK